MVKTNKKYTTVLDIGARYGIHPSWKNFSGEKKIILVEADPKEAKRLKLKFNKDKQINVFNEAIAGESKDLILNISNNPAMASFLKRRNVSPLFWGEKKSQQKIKSRIKIKSKTLDNFITKNRLEIDFLKIDVEGQEPEILLNSSKIYKNLLGVRSEVSFTTINSNNNDSKSGTFVSLHEKFISNDFILLNFDYRGKGDYYSRFTLPSDNYGILQNTDAVWIKNPINFYNSKNTLELFKYLSFLILNNAYDLCFFLLEKNFKINKNYKNIKNSLLYKFVRISVIKYLYKLKWVPNQSIMDHKKFYEKIFKETYPEMNKFNEDKDLNPN
jgi:FkbM family methyltransferase